MHSFKVLLIFLVSSLSAAGIQRDVAYVPGGSAAQRLDFYPAAVSGGKTPLVAWTHGGAWLGGDENQNPAEFLTRSGYSEVKELGGDLGSTNSSSRVQAVVNYFGPADLLLVGDAYGP